MSRPIARDFVLVLHPWCRQPPTAGPDDTKGGPYYKTLLKLLVTCS
jgi:hypothetical protein